MVQAVSEYCLSLVKQIEEKHPLSPQVRDAFLAVPRHVFLAPVDGVVSEEWLHEVYQDTAITTKRDERGMPLSSSSQPSVMALMLEALDVQPGQQILEIGTGTGYNAALLARLAGDPALVTTVDIDSALTTLARSRIDRVVGEGMTIVTSDGFEGYAQNAPYDRIIATASAFPVPAAWIAQLAPGGKLVLDLRGKIGGGLMMIEKQADGSTLGHFLAVKGTISFMGLRESTDGDARAERFAVPSVKEQTLYTSETVEYACAQHCSSYEQFRSADDAFNLWVQCAFPLLSIKWMQREKRTFALLVDGETKTTLVVERRDEQMGIAVKGERALWMELVREYQDWLSLGKPGRERFSLMITPEGQDMWIEQAGNERTLSIIR